MLRSTETNEAVDLHLCLRSRKCVSGNRTSAELVVQLNHQSLGEIVGYRDH